jgi:hypothetical protein
MQYQIVNGPTAIEIGADDYQLGPDGTWIKNQRAVPLRWPNYSYSLIATEARIDGEESVGGSMATIVAFNLGGFDFRFWIDRATERILKMTMDGPNHHMLSTYSEFDRAPAIEPPIP